MLHWTGSQETWVLLDSVAVKPGADPFERRNDMYNHRVEVINTWALGVQMLPRNGRKNEKFGRGGKDLILIF